jgi:uncharacterized membrane protein YhaH (DUF805 family)
MSLLGLNPEERASGALEGVSDQREPHWFSFKGRISRAAFLTRTAIGWFVGVGAFFAIGFDEKVFGRFGPEEGSAGTAYIILFLVLLIVYAWFMLATTAKRLHDIERSGMQCIFVILCLATPFHLMSVLSFQAGARAPNEFGADPLSKPNS